MKQIKFNSAVFNLVGDINIDASRLQATIYKGNYTVDQIADSTKDCNIIQVLNDGKIDGQYTGYTAPVAYSLNYEVPSGVPIVSIELANEDISSQINALSSQVSSQAEVVTGIAKSITRIDDAIDGLASIIGE